jgi:hypothetical protein
MTQKWKNEEATQLTTNKLRRKTEAEPFTTSPDHAKDACTQSGSTGTGEGWQTKTETLVTTLWNGESK